MTAATNLLNAIAAELNTTDKNLVIKVAMSTTKPTGIARTKLAKGIMGGCPCLPGQCKAKNAQSCANWAKRTQDKR